jgi:adenosylhomocysteinase
VTGARIASEVADPGLMAAGAARIDWAERGMPVLRRIRAAWTDQRPLAGIRVGACLHVTTETAVLARTLVAGGAELWLAASNPLSTQDDVAAALAAEGVGVHARSGVDLLTYRRHLAAVATAGPQLVLDDGCDLITTLHELRPDLLPGVIGGCEDTTTGVVRLRAMAAAGALAFPVLAVDDTASKRLADNRYGTGQSTVDALIRATNLLLAGRTIVIAGYGWCGRGIAARASGLGAHVVVTEVDPLRALEAMMDGHRVLPMAAAAPLADIVVTVTGNRDVVRGEHLELMADGTVLANAGHFDVEIDVDWLRHSASAVHRRVRPAVDEYVLADGTRLLLVADGRVVNLGAAEGNPAAVMDMAFADQALGVAWLLRHAAGLAAGVHAVPAHIDAEVARLALADRGVVIDRLTAEQIAYRDSWR